MLCDVCNCTVPPQTGKRIKSHIFTYLLDNGFGLDESNIKMLTDAGMPRSAAVAVLKAQYKRSTTDWLLCSQCTAKAIAVLARPH